MHDIRHVPFNEESLTRQRLIRVALAEEDADLVLEGATMLNVQTLTWKKDWDIVISGQRIAWVGPSGQWLGKARNRISISGLWAVPGFGEAHKHIESTMLSPEYEADLVLRYGNTWTIEGSHEFSNVNGRGNLEFWFMARKQGSPFKIFPSLGSATPPTGWEETGGYYGYDEIRQQIEQDLWVTGLDEVMDWAALVDPTNPGYQRLWENMQATADSRGVIEGHCAVSDPSSICAFVAAGISSDHVISFARSGEEAWDKLERGLFLQLLPTHDFALKYLVGKGLKDWSNLAITTDDRNAETTLRRGGMDHNIRVAIESGVPLEAAYSMASFNPARHFRIDHLVGSLTPGRYADAVLLSDPTKVVIEQVYADGKKVVEKGRPVVDVPKIDWPTWVAKTVNLGGVIEASHFAIRAPAGRDTATAAIMEPFKLEPDLVTATLPIENGLVQRDLAQGITKVALLDRYSGRIRVSKMFWKNVGMKTPESAMSCSIVHDNHNAWVTGSSDEAMALAVNTMAAIDGGYVLVREGKVVATIRLEIGGLMTARPAEAFAQDLNQMHREMEQIDWIYEGDFRLSEFLGVRQITEALSYAFLTCSPFRWVLVPPTDTVPDGLLNVRTGETHAVVW
jgi:adenine deaminase